VERVDFVIKISQTQVLLTYVQTQEGIVWTEASPKAMIWKDM